MPLKYKGPLAVLIVLIGLGGYFYFQVDWEVRAIRKQIEVLTGLVEKSGPVSTFEGLGRGRRLPGLFTETASIEYFRGRYLPQGADAISSLFLGVWGQINELSIRIVGHEVKIQQDGNAARSRVTTRTRVVMGGRDRVGDTLRYQVDWQKVDGQWRIHRILPIQ